MLRNKGRFRICGSKCKGMQCLKLTTDWGVSFSVFLHEVGLFSIIKWWLNYPLNLVEISRIQIANSSSIDISRNGCVGLLEKGPGTGFKAENYDS